MHVTPMVKTKVVASSSTPEPLGSSTLLMKSLLFIGEKAYDTPNATPVHIQVLDADSGLLVDAIKVEPAQMVPYSIDPGTVRNMRAVDFHVRVETDGDGVRVLYNTIDA